MKRLKALRESANYSQKELAERLKTTQQTIGRWETGKAEPNLAALRDLALLFGTSVDDLLNFDPDSSRRLPTPSYHAFVGKAHDGFWGHVGLKFPGQPYSKWFPVTLGAVDQLSRDMARVDKEFEWVTFSSLANKMIIFRPAAVEKITILDDNCDEVEGDWKVDLPYQGYPAEIYRAFDQLHGMGLDWDAAIAALPKPDEKGDMVGGDEKAWGQFIASLRSLFDGEASDVFLATVAEAFIEEELIDDDAYFQKIRYTSIHFTNGTSSAYWADEQDLMSLYMDIDAGLDSTMINIESAGSGFDYWYPSDRISGVVLPLLDLEDAIKRDEEALEKEMAKEVTDEKKPKKKRAG